MLQNLTLVKHPVISHKLGFLRDKNTVSAEFRTVMKEITKYLVYEASKDLETHLVPIETPMASTMVSRISNAPILVSVMRAGNGMLDAAMGVMPFASAGHIGIYRDKFIKNTLEYYFKLPEDVEGRTAFLLEPLIATGDTAIACIDRLKQYGLKKIKVLTILASRQGLNETFSLHPDVEIFTLNIEEEVDAHGYLIPGIGDAGDRLFNTD